MSDFRIDKITNRDGSAGTQIAGISTFSGTSGMVMPGGPTEYRGGRGRGIQGGGSSSVDVMDYVEIATTANAQDFGNLTVGRRSLGAVSSSTRGVFGGRDGGSEVIEFIILQLSISSLYMLYIFFD